ncbi:MAG: hypothetical protein ACREOG_08840, partial [Gemmatimonadaceae bacterium]
MSLADRTGLGLVAFLALTAGPALATGQATAKPTNDLPNPYTTVEGWAKLPEGRAWGSTSAVEIDKDGTSIWVFERCTQNTCANSDLPAILKFDASGRLVASFGAGMFISPHGIDVDHEGNVWVTDCACTGARRPADSTTPPPAPPTKGHQVFKFSPDGKLLMTLGKPGG